MRRNAFLIRQGFLTEFFSASVEVSPRRNAFLIRQGFLTGPVRSGQGLNKSSRNAFLIRQGFLT